MFDGAGLDYDGFITNYHWDFGEGDISNMENPTYTFSHVGTYTATLTVTDDNGTPGEDTAIITVN